MMGLNEILKWLSFDPEQTTPERMLEYIRNKEAALAAVKKGTGFALEHITKNHESPMGEGCSDSFIITGFPDMTTLNKARDANKVSWPIAATCGGCGRGAKVFPNWKIVPY